MSRTALQEFQELLPNCLRQDRLRLEAKARELLGRPHDEHLEKRFRRLADDAQRSVTLRHTRHERLPQISYPAALPITARKDEIVAAIRGHQVVVIAGETGSGKTTQIPKMCLEAGFGIEGKIACTQPRRVAALSISRRVAEELNVPWGKEVGCKIRFTDHSSPESYIKFMTDGILLAETQGDRELREYEVIVIDEAHERSLNIDFLLGHLKGVLRERSDLKLIITSATIETQAFSAAFNEAPIIEVSGRVFPIEIRYADFDHLAEERGEISYVEASTLAVEEILTESSGGDILVFMPSERDIREAQDDLAGRFRNEAEIVPLYARLTSEEQERAFRPTTGRRIIIATNIAETSLTIPGIRYVVDTGLARMSRYSPRTRTKRLPIEEISQSSANQRAGRCGRVSNGVCIRLFSQEDYEKRPKYTQPEIQRANLAEVILRMKAWRIGEIESFPFLNPPSPQAVNAGYDLLHELGAIDEKRELTPLGRELARLPIDPSMGRMVLQSIRERALEETLIIAAGLSIQDPRERPLDRQEAADMAHRQFLDPDSDFLALLNIWNTYHEQWEQLRTQSQLRRFCKANFLSYVRMREWADVHSQLKSALREVVDRSLLDASRAEATGDDPIEAKRREERKTDVANYAGIHRSILSGLLGHIAQRSERNGYKAARGREVTVFPGSSLFVREDRKKSSKSLKDLDAATEDNSGQPEWIVAGEIVETTRLFARTNAGVSAAWIIELAEHLCNRSHTEPAWVASVGRVLAREKITLFGLQLQDKQIDYGRVNAKHATELFARALAEGDVETPHKFVAHNARIRDQVELWRTRARNHDIADANQALFHFYISRLEKISSTHDLNRAVREAQARDPNYLFATEKDLTGGKQLAWDDEAFPREALVAGQKVALQYAYAPGEEHDGVTIRVPVAVAHNLEPAMLDWLVPGLREEQIEFLLKELPKSLRVPLMPLAPKVKELAAELRPGDDLNALRVLIHKMYGANIPAGSWSRDILPNHLRPRIAITGKNGESVAVGRDAVKLKSGLEKHETPGEQNAWDRAAQTWERFDLSGWSFGNLPEQIEVTQIGGAALNAFPGLEREGEHVNLKLFRRRDEALRATALGFRQLAENVLQKELAWLHKDLRALDKVKPLYVTLGPGEELTETAFINLKTHLVKLPSPLLPLVEAQFEKAVADARRDIPTALPRFGNWITTVLTLRQQLLVLAKPYAGMRADLDLLMPKKFLLSTPYDRLQHLERYLKAMLMRAERAVLNSARDAERARLVAPYLTLLRQFQGQAKSDAAITATAQLRWMIEEFKVSVFAQELGTAHPISAKRLDAHIETMKSAAVAG